MPATLPVLCAWLGAAYALSAPALTEPLPGSVARPLVAFHDGVNQSARDAVEWSLNALPRGRAYEAFVPQAALFGPVNRRLASR